MSNTTLVIMYLTMFISSSTVYFMIITKKINPITAMMMLIFFSISNILMISLTSMSFFYSFIMFLMLIGGIMIIFGYFTSTIGESMKSSKINFKMVALVTVFNPIVYLIKYFSSNLFPMNYMKINSFYNSFSIPTLNNIYLSENTELLIILFLLLIVILLVVLKMISPQNMSMKKKKKNNHKTKKNNYK